MRSLDDDFGGLGKRGGRTAPAYDAEGLGLVLGEAAHPLMENGGYDDVVIAVPVHILVGKLLERTDSGNILDEIAALAVTDGDITNALLRSEERFDNGDRMGDAGGNKGSGERAVGFTVDGNACFLVKTGEPVNILPVTDGLFHRYVLGVGEIVGNAAALVAGEAARIADLGEKPCIGGTVANLHGGVKSVDDLTAAGNAVVDCREAVQHGAALLHGFTDAHLRFLVAVLSGIAVDGRGEKIGSALVLKIGEKLNMVVNQRHACTGLNKGDAPVLGVDELS